MDVNSIKKLIVQLGTATLESCRTAHHGGYICLCFLEGSINGLALIEVHRHSTGKGIGESVDAHSLRREILPAIDNECAQGHKQFVDTLHHLTADEQLTPTRPHHGVVNYMARTIAAKYTDNDIENSLSAYESYLHHLWLNIVHHGIYLPRNDMCRQIEEFLDTKRSLYGDTGYGRHCMTTQRHHGVDISLHP